MQPPPQQQQQQQQQTSPARRQHRPTAALLLILAAAAAAAALLPSAHAFLLPSSAPPRAPAPSSLRRPPPLTVRQSFLNSFREEPWFTQDTVHVAEDGAEIMIETRALAPAPAKEEEEEEGHGHEHGQDVVMEGQEAGDGSPEGQGQGQGQGAGPEAGREYKVGVIVVDHGSRRAEANAALDGVVAGFRAVSGYDLVEPAHMELAEPSIATAFGRCVEQGATFIVCHPFFLSRGRHVVEDIPTLMEEAASIFPGVGWALSQPLGLQAEIPRLMQAAVADCMREHNVLSEDHAPPPAAAYGKDGMGL